MIALTQRKQRDAFTCRMIEKHIQAGMHVLDVGCGNGDTSFLIAEAVGESGKVIGVDRNLGAIDSALERKQISNRRNVSFTVADINELDGGTYDAVFGRRVLMYQPDPLRTIDMLKDVLKPGGIMLFQESDEAGTLLNGNHLPVHNMVQEWIWETVRREGGNTHIGSELYGIMKAVGMRVLDYCSELVLQTVESGSDLAWVVTMMQGRMNALGIHAEPEALEERLQEEMQTSDHIFVRDFVFGMCVQKP